ncbi:MAG: 16S rRNA (guanine(527)-N(7))-methyltransferase RsmG [Acidobacteriaceae bacterium]|nr:16S rRNA (guanine(527)-N(7))-methyltransferase RsmG [Acidobacteriaceae bacterium]MBV9444010.1 16S rRNA (guanine(527)-N(7))-methyltransferase RsmG [Acidobacteriaceae bacterium]
MQFEQELADILPLDVPNRALLIEKSARHLEMLVAVNEYMNLTRILGPKEAAIKHVFDCVAPWRHFEHSRRVLDAGTGAGFPGIPLAIVLPEVRFTLAESIGKKAKFVDSVVETLHLPNVHVANERAETIASAQKPDTITARAVAPTERLLDLFGKTVRHGARLLLFKGPEIEGELAQVRERSLQAEVLCRYDLPEALGTRSLIEIRASAVGSELPRKRATATRG